MAIPNPNPNIKDGVIVDNKTWSSSKIAEGFNAAGVNVGSDGTIQEKLISLVDTLTVEEAGTAFEFNVPKNTKKVLALVDVTFSDTASNNFSLTAVTNESSDTFINTGAYGSRSFTGNTRYFVRLYADCLNGLLQGNAIAVVPNSYGNVSSSLATDYVSGIIASGFKKIKVNCNASIPVGTIIQIYAV